MFKKVSKPYRHDTIPKSYYSGHKPKLLNGLKF